MLAKQLCGCWRTDCLKTSRLWNASSEHLNCDRDVTAQQKHGAARSSRHPVWGTLMSKNMEGKDGLLKSWYSRGSQKSDRWEGDSELWTAAEALTSLLVLSLCLLQQHCQLSLPFPRWKGCRCHFLPMSPFCIIPVLSEEKDQDVKRNTETTILLLIIDPRFLFD